MARLIGIEGPLKGKSFELAGDMLIGRLPECDIRLDSPSVSRRHARIQSTQDGVSIEDLGSVHGTLVNGQIIAGRALLRDQDVVDICDFVFRFADIPEGQELPEPVEREEAGMPALGEGVGVEVSEEEAGSNIEGVLDIEATMVGGVFAPSAAGDQAKANERLQSVIRISSAIQTELELRVLLSLVLDNLFEVFRLADRAFLMLYDESGDLKPAAARNREGRPEKITISRSIVNEVTSRRVAVLSSDAMLDERFTGAMSIVSHSIRSMMCAPLIAKDDLLGILHVDTTRENRRFTEDDLELLSGVAAQTALAIASAKMHEKLLARDRMERDLKVATQVQKSFLPGTIPEAEGMEFAAFYHAALEIGGDMYDFIPQPDDKVLVVVGDVSGKGIPAALLMARTSSDVRFYAVQESEPKDVLPHLTRRLDETGMSDVFVTMALIRVDLNTHETWIANAGHCKPLVRRGAEGDVVEAGGRPELPVGMMPEFEYTQASYALQSGDVMCLVTDGVTEAMDADKNLYGTDRLVEAIAAAPPSASGVLEAVLADVKKHVGDTKQSDDLTCVCFGVTVDGGEAKQGVDTEALLLELEFDD